jgi:hypothetical protein
MPRQPALKLMCNEEKQATSHCWQLPSSPLAPLEPAATVARHRQFTGDIPACTSLAVIGALSHTYASVSIPVQMTGPELSSPSHGLNPPADCAGNKKGVLWTGPLGCAHLFNVTRPGSRPADNHIMVSRAHTHCEAACDPGPCVWRFGVWG